MSGLGSRSPGRRRFARSTGIGFAAGLVLATFLGSCATAPTVEDAAADAARKEMEVGEAAFAKLAGFYGVVQDEEATRYLNLLLKSLAIYGGRQELDYRAAILATDQVNAFALPGGIVLVTLGTVKRVETPGALAGVLAHELGHVYHEHILRNVSIEVEYSVVETLARVLAGSRQVITGAVGQINDRVEERLFFEGYAANDEFDADAYAVDLLQTLGIDASEYRSFLASLAEAPGSADLENLDKTHPPLDDRIAAIDGRIVTDGTEPLPHTPEFEAFRQRVSGFELEQDAYDAVLAASAEEEAL